MVATNVIDIGVLDELPDLGLLKVIKGVMVGSTQVGAETSVVASDDNTAATSLLGRLDTVLDTEASGVDSVLHNGGVLVIASAAEVDDAVGGQDVLGTTGRVLSGTTSDELGLVVVQKVFVQRQVLLFSENGVISLEAILVKQSLVTDGLDVCEMRRTIMLVKKKKGSIAEYQ